MTGRPLLIDVTPVLAGHLTIAIREHRAWATRTGLQLPPGLAEVEAHLTSRATQGQRGTPVDDLWEVRDGSHVTPRLLTYDDAARVLSCSVRTVKRLVQAGDLRPVRVGGISRLRVTDLDSYVDDL